MIFVPNQETVFPLGMDWRTAAASNLITDVVRVAPLGTNVDIDTTSFPEDVWSGSALGVLNAIDHKLVQTPSSAIATEVVSDSANDTSAGTGCRTVIVGYLDSSYVAKTTTLTMNGTTPVALPENIIAINSMIRGSVGTFRGSNIGNISVRLVGGLGATYSYMEAAKGFARSSLYTVPDGYTLYIYTLLLAINRVDTADRWATFSLPVMSSTGAVLKALEVGCSSNTPYRHEADNLPLNTVAQKNSIWVTCEATSASNTSVTAGYAGFIIKNTRLIVSP